MSKSFSKYKNAESILQERIAPLGYSVTIEPISGTDIYYSDGSAAHSHGKAVFTDKKSEFCIFFPDYYCFFSIPPSIKDELSRWLNEVNQIS